MVCIHLLFLSFSCSVLSDCLRPHVAHQSLSTGFLNREHRSGLHRLPTPRIEPVSPGLASRFFTTEHPGKPQFAYYQLVSTHRFRGSIPSLFYSLSCTPPGLAKWTDSRSACPAHRQFPQMMGEQGPSPSHLVALSSPRAPPFGTLTYLIYDRDKKVLWGRYRPTCTPLFHITASVRKIPFEKVLLILFYFETLQRGALTQAAAMEMSDKFCFVERSSESCVEGAEAVLPCRLPWERLGWRCRSSL